MLLLYLAFPVVSVWAVSPRGRLSFAERVVHGLALYETALLVTGLTLGHLGWLRPTPYAAVLGALSIALAIVARKRGPGIARPPRLPHLRRWLLTRRGTVVGVLVAGVILLFGVQLVADAAMGTRHWDGLWYHIPRTLIWLQQGNFDPWPTPAWQQIGLPVGANLVLGTKTLLGLGWAGAAYVNALLTGGAILCVFLIGRDMGLDRWRAVLASILFASFPAVGERVGSVSSDIAAAFPVLAGYLVSRRSSDPAKGLAAFILLSGVGLACKSSVAPFVVLLGVLSVHRAWRAGMPLRPSPAMTLSAAAALSLLVASFWPVYSAFHDLVGGTTGRMLAVHDGESFARGVLVNAANWAMEPLGYAPPPFRSWLPNVVRAVYAPLGVQFGVGELPSAVRFWEPLPGPDTGRTGALSIVAFLGLIAWLPSAVRRIGVSVFILAFVLISGMLHYQPYSGRFTIVLLAGYALLWASARPFARIRTRKWLAVIAAANLSAAVAVTAFWTLELVRQSREGGMFDLVTETERLQIASRLQGAPLSVLTGWTPFDALLPGPEVSFAIRYLPWPDGCDLFDVFERVASDSRGIALVHGGRTELSAAPTSPTEWCPDVDVEQVRAALRNAGWIQGIARPNVDVWFRGGALEAPDSSR